MARLQIKSITALREAAEALEATSLKDAKIIEILKNPAVSEVPEVDNLLKAIGKYRANHDRTFTVLRTFSAADLAKLEEKKPAIKKRMLLGGGLAIGGMFGFIGAGAMVLFSEPIAKSIHSDASSGAEVMKRFSELTPSQAVEALRATEIVIAAMTGQAKLVE